MAAIMYQNGELLPKLSPMQDVTIKCGNFKFGQFEPFAISAGANIELGA